MKRYAFFLDIDGTTLANGVIPEENVAAINAAVENGHYVFVCTGRSYSRLGPVVLDAANWSGVITSLGAEIHFGGEKIRNRTLSPELAEKIASEILKSDVWLIAGNGDGCIAINRDDAKSVRVNDEASFASALKGITKLDMSPTLPEKIEQLVSEEMKIFYHKTYSEAAIKDVSKSEAIEFILKKLNVPRENSVAIGDSVNDLDMLEYAGIGVAVANASEEVKAAADMITESEVNCGVAKAIREICGI